MIKATCIMKGSPHRGEIFETETGPIPAEMAKVKERVPIEWCAHRESCPNYTRGASGGTYVACVGLHYPVEKIGFTCGDSNGKGYGTINGGSEIVDGKPVCPFIPPEGVPEERKDSYCDVAQASESGHCTKMVEKAIL